MPVTTATTNDIRVFFFLSHKDLVMSADIMWFLTIYPRWQQPSLSPAPLPPSLSPPSLRPPPPPPPLRSLTTSADRKQSRRPTVLHERSPESDLPAVHSSKPHLSHSPCVGDLVVDNRIPLPSLAKVSETERTLVHAQAPPLDVATSDQAVLPGFAVKSQATPPLELDVATCEEGVRKMTPEITVKSQAPALGMVTREKGVLTLLPPRTSTKSKHTTSNKMPSTSWVVMFLFLINVLPSLIFAQISTTEYVTFVAGTDTVDAALSNTPPNVFPGARGFHAGFYERSQKCYYAFGGGSRSGN